MDQDHTYTILEAALGGGGVFGVMATAPARCDFADYRLPDFDGVEFLAQINTESLAALPGDCDHRLWRRNHRR